MMASLRSDLRGVSSLISALSTTSAGLVVSLGGATVASAAAFLFVLVFFLGGAFFATVRGFFFGVVCPSTFPATIRKAIANTHNLIRYFFIALYIIWSLLQVENHGR